jgi:hypothetical protein
VLFVVWILSLIGISFVMYVGGLTVDAIREATAASRQRAAANAASYDAELAGSQGFELANEWHARAVAVSTYEGSVLAAFNMLNFCRVAIRTLRFSNLRHWRFDTHQFH